MFFETLQVNTLGAWLAPIMPTSRLYFLYIVTACIMALLAYWRIEKAHDHHHAEHGDAPAPDSLPERPSSFLAYVLNPEILFHRSTKQDLKYFLVNALVYSGIATQFLWTTQGVAWAFHQMLVSLAGANDVALMSSVTALVVYTVLSALLIDFGVYITHRMHHKIPLLWHFHAVHHSAEVMTPLTLFRMHPVDLAITSVTVAFLTGICYGGLFYLNGEAPQEMTVFGLNIIFMLFYVFGYNLRHSHIWVNYPAWLSRIFISPAQHQIHHSSDPKHFDKNMGLIFAFWDDLFGTLYVPKGYEKLTFGLSRDVPNPFGSIADIYLKPFVWARQTINESRGDRVGRISAYAGLASIAVVVVAASVHLSDKRPGWHLPSLMLADLTWTEAHEALERGYDTIIIPTGGVEQNGPFVALGKHNVIVERTALQMAKSLGNALVAPVMAYVPEGDIETREGHMAWTGTLSLPEPVFEDVLEATALSLKVHGFKNIFFVGDSGSSQAAQNAVAERLQAVWLEDGMLVANIEAYYSGNGQFDHLRKAGFRDDDIGYHAGIRDTSELMYVSGGRDVRLRRDFTIPEGYEAGVYGAPGYASKAIGAEMIALKVDAGLNQMRALLANGRAKSDPGVMVMQDGVEVDRSATAATR